MSFWGELRRRNVVKVAGAYAVVAWLLVQVSSVFAPALNLPTWVTSFVAFVLVIGFPIALVLSWAYELTPEGIRKTRQVPLEDGIANMTGQRFNYFVTALLTLAVVFLVVDNYVMNDDAEGQDGQAADELTDQGSQTAASAEEGLRSKRLPNSVAVLPCDNFSADPEDAFFAASLHEELLNQLFKLRNMNVIARTSVLQYARAARPITEIANELRVESVMECSVAYGDGRIVISAQLIDGDSGLHIWSDRYNREFQDVFGIQADIAMNVANALAVEFSTDEQRGIEREETDSPEAYALYLRALDLRSRGDARGAIRLIDQALGFDTNFATAHALKAALHSSFLVNTGTSNAVSEEERGRELELARLHADRAAELEPALAWQRDLGYDFFSWRWGETLDAVERAPDPIGNISWAYSLLGMHERALARARRAVELDPNRPGSWQTLGIALAYAGNYDEAVLAQRKSIELGPVVPLSHSWFAFMEIARGNDEEALKELRFTEQILGENPPIVFLPEIAYSYSRIGRGEDVARIIKKLGALTEPKIGAGGQAMISLAIGDANRAKEWLELGIVKVQNNEPDEGFWNLINIRMNVTLDPLLEEAEFAALRNRLRGT